MQNEELEQLQTIKIASPAVYVNSSLEAGLAVRGQSHTVGTTHCTCSFRQRLFSYNEVQGNDPKYPYVHK